MMPWQTPHFNPFTKSQSNATGSVPAFLTNTVPGGCSSPQVTWHKMTQLLHLTSVFWILAHRYFSFSKAFLCHFIWSITSIVKEEVLALKHDCKIGLTTSQRSQLNSHLQTWSFLSLPTLGSTVIFEWAGKAEDCLNCSFSWKSLLYRYTSLLPIPVISIAFGR